MTYRCQNSQKSNFATERPRGVSPDHVAMDGFRRGTCFERVFTMVGDQRHHSPLSVMDLQQWLPSWPASRSDVRMGVPPHGSAGAGSDAVGSGRSCTSRRRGPFVIAHDDLYTDDQGRAHQVQPRSRKITNKMGMGIPKSQSNTHPIAPSSSLRTLIFCAVVCISILHVIRILA
jgi:hypothetical protein